MNKAIANKVLVIVLHVCGWALLFMLPFRFMLEDPHFVGESVSIGVAPDSIAGFPASADSILFKFSERGIAQNGIVTLSTMPIDTTLIRLETVLTNSLLAIFFYGNMFVLIPKILSKKGWGHYVLLIALVLLAYLIAGYLFRYNYFQHEGDLPGDFHPPFFIGIPNFFMVFGISLALRLMQDKSSYESALKERENEKLKSELSFLRSQVSPHFMFNVLNSLASLARKKSDQVESAVIQLSQLMRYTLYHTDKRVTLEQETEYIGNYINLQKLRFGTMVNMHFHVDIEQRDVLIEPMLLVPFVENAFKHGVGLIREPVIIIILESTPSRIHYTVRNKFNPVYTSSKDPGSGIGLNNVRRRLDLLYKDQYSLETYTTEGHWFVAELKLFTQS
jgi:two-component system, LytTR family, sensor kinase